MGVRELRIPYPEELLRAANQTPEEFEDELRFLVAAKLYELGRVTSGHAARLAGVDRVEFLERLGAYQISGFNYGAEELDRLVEAGLWIGEAFYDRLVEEFDEGF